LFKGLETLFSRALLTSPFLQNLGQALFDEYMFKDVEGHKRLQRQALIRSLQADFERDTCAADFFDNIFVDGTRALFCWQAEQEGRGTLEGTSWLLLSATASIRIS
jgi:hypothetical protein